MQPLIQIAPECDAWLTESPVTIGLSGGRDSVALLLLLLRRGVQVHACHIHHGIRGEAADADARFCAELCLHHQVPFELQEVDVPALAAARRESLETVARHERRRLLADFAVRHGCKAIALAHHADDQAETVLFHLARGSAGLRGMRPVSLQKGVVWLRPLIYCRRDDITAWLQELHQPWREDATNSVADVTRNVLRLEALPALNRALGRDVTPVLCRSVRLQSEVAEALHAALQSLPLLDPQGRLYLPFLQNKPASFCKAAVHYYLQQVGVSDLTEEHVQAVCTLISPEAQSSVHNLPGGLRARRSHKRLYVERPDGSIICTASC